MAPLLNQLIEFLLERWRIKEKERRKLEPSGRVKVSVCLTYIHILNCCLRDCASYQQQNGQQICKEIYIQHCDVPSKGTLKGSEEEGQQKYIHGSPQQ